MNGNGKIRIVVLMGGPSAEHEVSLNSGEMVMNNLDPAKYEATAVVVGKDGKWPISFKKLREDFDIAFVAMHGEYGEDGTLQAILEKEKIPFTGSDSRASRLGMDKVESAKVLGKAGLLIPTFTVLSAGGGSSFGGKNDNGHLFDFPVVVKPTDRGSTVGVSIVDNVRDLPKAIELARKSSENVMIQKYIKGRELTCGVLEVDGKLQVLPPTEIMPRKSKFFDYESKYTPGGSLEVTPPKMFNEEIKKIQEAALAAHKAIGARGYSRADFIFGEDGKLYTLEINTLPGLTETSLLPQEAKAAGINFPKLLDSIIMSAWPEKK